MLGTAHCCRLEVRVDGTIRALKHPLIGWGARCGSRLAISSFSVWTIRMLSGQALGRRGQGEPGPWSRSPSRPSRLMPPGRCRHVRSCRTVWARCPGDRPRYWAPSIAILRSVASRSHIGMPTRRDGSPRRHSSAMMSPPGMAPSSSRPGGAPDGSLVAVMYLGRKDTSLVKRER